MAYILAKYGRDGRRTYRVTFRKRGCRSASVTVDTRQQAEKFTELHEKEFMQDPEAFDVARAQLRLQRGY